ncbi:hypothetical protein PGUG_03922 [Meyerozyma guilliermondii ATCC 6260]|uniref:Protein HMF1 n=1 Tax=Meyerozyma guilliermondii (strain ATCC 6260 / CBS 566 / DSM 6381 / JCM 1539 / NBRC 10279 / NRRL Y-324) TaxID=294746 RepID=A5DKX1_PICGU|nr:uncharacterized protein PGUG_03922 [Meyerozyma guilliermondii ATCC 6260]EDK39824.2 hypothetical protein PGUG_03922 [Meyerozyma guilliermondii ATCC 6260]
MKQVTWEQVGQKFNPILSPAYISNGLVLSSGSVGVRSDGVVAETAAEQTTLAIENMKTVLEKSGSNLNKVVKVLLFITDEKDSKVVNEVYHKYFPHSPARSCVIVKFPSTSLKVELECVAEVV